MSISELISLFDLHKETILSCTISIIFGGLPRKQPGPGCMRGQYDIIGALTPLLNLPASLYVGAIDSGRSADSTDLSLTSGLSTWTSYRHGTLLDHSPHPLAERMHIPPIAALYFVIVCRILSLSRSSFFRIEKEAQLQVGIELLLVLVAATAECHLNLTAFFSFPSFTLYLHSYLSTFQLAKVFAYTAGVELVNRHRLSSITPHYGAHSPAPHSLAGPVHYCSRTIPDCLGSSSLHILRRENPLLDLRTLQSGSPWRKPDAGCRLLHSESQHQPTFKWE
jgi:hypothetical protein